MSITGKDSDAFAEGGVIVGLGAHDFSESRAHDRGVFQLFSGWDISSGRLFAQGFSATGETTVFKQYLGFTGDVQYARFRCRTTRLQIAGIYGLITSSSQTNDPADMAALGVENLVFRLVDQQGNQYRLCPGDIHVGYTLPLPVGILAGSTVPTPLLANTVGADELGVGQIFNTTLMMGGSKAFYMEYDILIALEQYLPADELGPEIFILSGQFRTSCLTYPFTLNPPMLSSGPGALLIH